MWVYNTYAAGMVQSWVVLSRAHCSCGSITHTQLVWCRAGLCCRGLELIAHVGL